MIRSRFPSAPRRRPAARSSAAAALFAAKFAAQLAAAVAAGALLCGACTVVIDDPRDTGPGPDAAAGDASDAAVAPSDAGPDGADGVLPPGDGGGPPNGDVVLPRDVVSPRDTGDPPDTGSVDVAPADVRPRPDIPPLRYCPWDMAATPVYTRSTFLRGADFAAEATTLSSPIDRACESGLFPSRDRAERVFVVVPEAPATLTVRTRCEGWDCDAVLLDGDCVTSNVAACVTEEGDVRLQREVAPGFALLQLEPRLDAEPGPFDLLVALSYAEGRDPCPVTDELRLSTLADQGPCETVDDGGVARGVRVVRIEGDTAASGAADDVFPDCRGPGIDPDSVGGAPDRIWRIVHDAPDGAARRMSARVAAPDDAWEPVVAVTGGPCGAADAVIDCDRGAGRPAAVEDVTIFGDETLYVVVDGVGELLWEDRAAGPFVLTLWVSDPTCDAVER